MEKYKPKRNFNAHNHNMNLIKALSSCATLNTTRPFRVHYSTGGLTQEIVIEAEHQAEAKLGIESIIEGVTVIAVKPTQ